MRGIINNIGWVSKKPPNQQYMNRSLEAGAEEMTQGIMESAREKRLAKAKLFKHYF